MGSKGNSVSTQQSQTQQYTPNAPIGGAIQQAVTGAEQAAATPFQQPVAPVAPFSPFQQQAFGQIQGTQGMAQPYFNAGQSYLQNSAAPISASDVNQYYNPMASNVTAQMQNIFGQQDRNFTGQLTQAAGGVGADRIAVGQGELSNQQGLAAGQTYAGLYQQALQAAQQNKQMQAGAGYGISQLGPAAQNASLQGTTALGQAGSQQQAQQQAQQTAQYQNILSQIAYPFQTSQYLAGIAGGLAPAAGGTTTGNSQGTTTYPTPSPLSQAIGLGTAGLGAYGAAGGFKGSNTGAISQPGYNTNQIGMFGGNRGGRVYAQGGGVYPDLSIPGFDDGGEVDQSGIFGQGLPFPGSGQIPKGVIPSISLPAGGGHSGLFPGQQMKMQAAPTMSQNQSSGGVGDAMKVAASVLPFVLARGGSAYPRHFATDGFVDDKDSPGGIDWGSANLDKPYTTPWAAIGQSTPQVPITYDKSADSTPIEGPSNRQIEGPSQPGGIQYKFPMPTLPKDASRVAAGNSAGPEGSSPYPKWEGPQQPAGFETQEADSGPTGPRGSRGRQNADMTPEQYFMPKSQQPYPDATQRDWGQNLTRSPWMSLVKAGAEMASSTGPIGSVIGKGIKAGAGELDSQRKELRSEQDHNQKADALWQRAKVELDKYQRMTPAELAHTQIQKQHLAQGKWQVFDYIDKDDPTQPPRAARVNAMTGEAFDIGTGQKANIGRVIGRSAGMSNNKDDARIRSEINTLLKFNEHAGKSEPELRAIARQRLGLGPEQGGAPAPQAAPSRPTGVPPTAGYSPSKKMWFTQDGQSWDASGQKTQ